MTDRPGFSVIYRDGRRHLVFRGGREADELARITGETTPDSGAHEPAHAEAQRLRERVAELEARVLSMDRAERERQQHERAQAEQARKGEERDDG